jgi:hypothetical protein
MAKKIQLNKQTLRELSTEEMEAVAGGLDATPITPYGCHTRDGDTTDTTVATTMDTTLAAETPITPYGCHTRDGDTV